jgi:hypothetical protein
VITANQNPSHRKQLPKKAAFPVEGDFYLTTAIPLIYQKVACKWPLSALA